MKYFRSFWNFEKVKQEMIKNLWESNSSDLEVIGKGNHQTKDLSLLSDTLLIYDPQHNCQRNKTARDKYSKLRLKLVEWKNNWQEQNPGTQYSSTFGVLISSIENHLIFWSGSLLETTWDQSCPKKLKVHRTRGHTTTLPFAFKKWEEPVKNWNLEGNWIDERNNRGGGC